MPKKMNVQAHPRAEHFAEMIAMLREAPYTADEIHELAGMSASTARLYLHALHQTMPPSIYIDHWSKGKHYYVPHYKLKTAEHQKDAVHPLHTPAHKAYLAKKKRLARAKKNANLSAKVGFRVDGRALKVQFGPQWREAVHGAL